MLGYRHSLKYPFRAYGQGVGIVAQYIAKDQVSDAFGIELRGSFMGFV
jgi:hypothetical protein